MGQPSEIVAFWRDAGYRKWFARDDAFDAEFTSRFLDTHFAAARREHEDWLDDADSALALVIVLDQLPRNAFRDSAHSYATDPLALHYAGRAIDAGHDAHIDAALRGFLYMPFEHAETMDDQERAVALFEALGDANSLRFARAHRTVIERFGRFPHRNRALGRENTAEEQAHIDSGGSF